MYTLRDAFITNGNVIAGRDTSVTKKAVLSQKRVCLFLLKNFMRSNQIMPAGTPQVGLNPPCKAKKRGAYRGSWENLKNASKKS